MIAVIVAVLAVLAIGSGLVLGTGIAMLRTEKRQLGRKLLIFGTPVYVVCIAVILWLNLR